jgi:glucose-1-phosphate cytidylyltransferase
VLSRDVGNYIHNDQTVWEQEPLEKLAEEEELQAFRHEGFFQPMDTLRDRIYLEQLWSSGAPPWKCW